MQVIRAPRSQATTTVPRQRRVLAIVGDSQVGLWVVRSLGRGGLTVFAVCGTQRGLSVPTRYAAGVWAHGKIASESQFIDDIEALARQLDVGSIMTIAEDFHAALIRNRARFEPDIHLFSPSQECFAKATDKDFMSRLCTDLGVPVARGTTLDKLMSGQTDHLQFPLVLRTRKQAAGDQSRNAPWKAAYAQDRRQLDELYRTVEELADNVVVQEYHPGVEDHVQILMRGGEAFMAGEYIGEHHMPLAGGVTVQRVSCRHDDLIADAVKVLKAIGWEGIAGVQFHFDTQTNRYIFLEINPRFIGGLPTVILAGFDAPFLLWQSHFEPDRMRVGKYRLGMRTRILGGDANWMLAMFRRDPLPPGQKHVGRLRALGSFIWHSGPWTHDDTLYLRDPRPYWTDIRNMIGSLGARSHDILGKAAGEGAKA